MDMSIGTAPPIIASPRTTELGPELDWIVDVLWPGADVRLAPARVPPGRRVAEAYAVIPNRARPDLLVPFSAPSLAAPALSRAYGTSSVSSGLARAILTWFASSSPGLSRFRPLVVFFDRDPRRDELLTGHLRTVFDRPDLVLAISLGAPGPERIPEAQAFTLDGEAVGLARVGWNGLTRERIHREATTLRRWAHRPPRTFRAPYPVLEERWGEHALSLLTPRPAAQTGGRPVRMPAVEVTREIAGAGGISLMPFGSTPWWRSVLARAGDEPVATVLRWMQDLHGRRLVWHGSWHGDWVPQNLRAMDGGLHVEAWDRAADGVPLGLDPIHFAFGAASRGSEGVSRAARTAFGRVTPVLRSLGVPREDDALLMAAYLAELVGRPNEEHRAPPALRTALVAELRRWVGRA